MDTCIGLKLSLIAMANAGTLTFNKHQKNVQLNCNDDFGPEEKTNKLQKVGMVNWISVGGSLFK